MRVIINIITTTTTTNFSEDYMCHWSVNHTLFLSSRAYLHTLFFSISLSLIESFDWLLLHIVDLLIRFHWLDTYSFDITTHTSRYTHYLSIFLIHLQLSFISIQEHIKWISNFFCFSFRALLQQSSPANDISAQPAGSDDLAGDDEADLGSHLIWRLDQAYP